MARREIQAWVAVVAVLVGVAVLACSEPVAPEATDVPADAGAEGSSASEAAALLEERCGQHHNLVRVEGASKTREEWQRTVTRMVEKGATLSADEQETIVEYLTEIAGP